MEILDVTEAFFAEIDRIATLSYGALELIGGNLLVHVDDVGTRTVVCSGRTKGLYTEATDDPIHCALILPQWVLLHLIDPDPARPIDFESLVADGTMVIDGDFGIYERFMALGQKRKNALSIRAA